MTVINHVYISRLWDKWLSSKEIDDLSNYLMALKESDARLGVLELRQAELCLGEFKMDERIADDYAWDYMFDYYFSKDRPEPLEEDKQQTENKWTGVEATPTPFAPTFVRTDPFTKNDVAEVIALDNGINEELDWIAVFLLFDGRYVYADGGCDYTGWG